MERSTSGGGKGAARVQAESTFVSTTKRARRLVSARWPLQSKRLVRAAEDRKNKRRLPCRGVAKRMSTRSEHPQDLDRGIPRRPRIPLERSRSPPPQKKKWLGGHENHQILEPRDFPGRSWTLLNSSPRFEQVSVGHIRFTFFCVFGLTGFGAKTFWNARLHLLI